MRDGWDRVRFSSVATKAGLVGGPFGSNLGRRDYVAAGVPVLRGQNLSAGRFVSFDDCVFVTEDKAETELARNVALPGDLIFTQRGTLGQVAVVPDGQYPRAIVSQSQMRLRVDPARADPMFVFYYATSAAFLRDLDNRAIVGGVPHINLGILGEMTLPMPPMHEQRRIAGVLGALDELIQTNESIRSECDDLGRTVVRTLCGRGFAAAFDGMPSAGWVATTVGDAASLIETGKRPRGGVSGILTGVPSIGAESIKGLGIFDFGKIKYVPADFASSMKRGAIQSRDVLVYKDGGKPGDFKPKVGMLGDGFPFEKMTINEHVYRVRMGPPLSEPFLYFWLSSEPALDYMRMVGTGAAIPGLNSTAFKSVPLAVPPVPLREHLLPALESLVATALGCAKEAMELRKVRDELLPLLMSGAVSPGEVAA